MGEVCCEAVMVCWAVEECLWSWSVVVSVDWAAGECVGEMCCGGVMLWWAVEREHVVGCGWAVERVCVAVTAVGLVCRGVQVSGH